MEKKCAIGIDIGGTKIAVGLVTPDGQILDTLKVSSDVSDAESLFTCILGAVNSILRSNKLLIEQIIGIGVGLPGKVDVDKGVAVFQNNIPWQNFPIVKRLRDIFGDLPIKIDNDVKVAAYAEYRLLNLPFDAMFSYITISTGIAAANISNNHIIRGTGFAGEIGFCRVNYLDKNATLEDTCSGPAIQRFGYERYKDETITTEKIFKKWRNGESVALEIIEATENALVDVIQNIICLLDPEVIVLGGSVAIYNPDFVQGIINKLKSRLHSEQLHILNNIYISKIDGKNGVLGAAFLVI